MTQESASPSPSGKDNQPSRKARREAFLSNDKNFRSIFETSLDAIVITDEAGQYLAVNAAACQLFGYSEAELLTMSVAELNIPPDEPNPAELFEQYKQQTREKGEFIFLRADGERRIAEYSACQLSDHYHLSILRDITERKRAEHHHHHQLISEKSLRTEAQESEQNYRSLAEAIPQIVWTATPDGALDYYNQRWYEYTGLSSGQSYGWGWQEVIHPDDLPRCQELWQRSVTTGEIYQIEFRLRRASDGIYRWQLARALPLRDNEGKIIRWFGTSTDINDNKQTEQRLSFLAEASAILASSLDYKTTLANVARLTVPMIADWCAVDMVEEDRSLRRLAVVHTDPSKIEFAYELERRYPINFNDEKGLPNVLRTGQPERYDDITDEMLVRSARDEEHLRIMRELGLRSCMILPLQVRGRVLGVVSFVTAESNRHYGPEDLAFAMDLAYRAALAVDNARLYQQSLDANRIKEEFLGTISHELRTPLTAMLGWTRLLKSGKLDPPSFERAIETIERNARAQSQLIEDLLDISRIISGKLRIETRPLDAGPIIEAVANSLMPAADAKSIKLSTRLDAAGQISGDPSRLQQIVWNLLANAIKFTPEGGAVEVLLTRAHGQVEIVVKDTGQGIAPEFLPHVFERFRQADSTSTRTHGGLGLGLAIVRHLVELHGGTITVASDGEGKGAAFTVRLPLLVAQYIDGRPERRHTQQEASDAPQLTGIKVLLVDDETDTRDLLKVILDNTGAQVQTASSAAAALAKLDEWLPDIIVSDIGMPGEDGYELIRKVRERTDEQGGRIPALALTAYVRSEDRRRALRAGFQMHVPKPVEPAELITVIASLTRR